MTATETRPRYGSPEWAARLPATISPPMKTVDDRPVRLVRRLDPPLAVPPCGGCCDPNVGQLVAIVEQDRGGGPQWDHVCYGCARRLGAIDV